MVVLYKGKGISTNVAYSGGWRNRYEKTSERKATFNSLLSSKTEHMFDAFEIHVSYNGRFDIDNTVATIKIFVDSMRDMGIIKEDNSRNFKKLTIKYNPTQTNPSYVFTVNEYSAD